MFKKSLLLLSLVASLGASALQAQTVVPTFKYVPSNPQGQRWIQTNKAPAPKFNLKTKAAAIGVRG
jgi:hypothetical protein